MTERVDVVVVGSGPGGAVTARECARAGLRVVVLEEGPWVSPGEVPPFTLDQMRRQYRAQGLTAAVGRPTIAYTEACCVGGGSEVNAGLYHRTPEDVLRRWATERSIEDLDAAGVEPFQHEVERELGIAGHPDEVLPASSEVLARGAQALGWCGQDVPRWVGTRPGENPVPMRRSMLATYLPQAMAAGAEVRAGHRVRRLVRQSGGGFGVEVDRRSGGSRPQTIQADQVVVCAGAINTPALLQRSGVRGSGHVGRHLSVHPTVKVVAHFEEDVNDPSDVASYQVKEFAPLMSFGGSAGAPPLLALQLAENWPQFGRHLEDWRRLGSYYASVTPTGRGRVTSVPRLADPLVTYGLTRSDLNALRSGLGRLALLMLAAGAHAVYPSFTGASTIATAADIPKVVATLSRRTASLMTVHLTGTARMGASAQDSVTDAYGRVHGIPGLWVNDASLIPDAPGVNPQGTVMMLAHRNVKELLS